jgi:hypothetical protein
MRTALHGERRSLREASNSARWAARQGKRFTEPLTRNEWLVVLALSLITPALVWADNTIQLHRQKTARSETGGEPAAPGRRGLPDSSLSSRPT